jgi:hypothetical protein
MRLLARLTRSQATVGVISLAVALSVVTACGGDDAAPASTTQPSELEGDPEAYYRSLGVSDDVIQCHLKQLRMLEVVNLAQLEADPALGAEAATRFDACVADPTIEPAPPPAPDQ